MQQLSITVGGFVRCVVCVCVCVRAFFFLLCGAALSFKDLGLGFRVWASSEGRLEASSAVGSRRRGAPLPPRRRFVSRFCWCECMGFL